MGKWHRNEEPVTRLFSKLSEILNLNEQFEMGYTFHLEMTNVRNPGRGSGKRKIGTKLGMKHIQQMLKSKKSVVVINKDDKLCCARALVTTKAYQDQDPRYKDIRARQMSARIAPVG